MLAALARPQLSILSRSIRWDSLTERRGAFQQRVAWRVAAVTPDDPEPWEFVEEARAAEGCGSRAIPVSKHHMWIQVGLGVSTAGAPASALAALDAVGTSMAKLTAHETLRLPQRLSGRNQTLPIGAPFGAHALHSVMVACEVKGCFGQLRYQPMIRWFDDPEKPTKWKQIANPARCTVDEQRNFGLTKIRREPAMHAQLGLAFTQADAARIKVVASAAYRLDD